MKRKYDKKVRRDIALDPVKLSHFKRNRQMIQIALVILFWVAYFVVICVVLTRLGKV